MIYVFLAGVSCFIQLVSAVLAAGLIRLTRRWFAWSVICAALLVMTARRAIPIYIILTTGSTSSINITQEYLGLVISILMFAGIITIRPMFLAIKESERTARENEASLRQANIQIQNAFDDLIDALARTVETQDEYTASHQRCVTDLAVRIAEEMSLTDLHIRALRMASTVHDVGKIYVPSEILNKPGAMSEIEYELSKEHTLYGNKILKNVRFPLPIAEIVYQHHERLDGSGYPRGLKGDEIMVEAKILAVADVVNAMSADRPYRPAMGVNKALKEIEKNRGKLYDSEIVDVCIRLFKEMNYHFKEADFREAELEEVAPV